jgi:hypothetical protein
MYWLTLLAQGVVGLAQLYVLSLPPRIAALWFGAKERGFVSNVHVCFCEVAK